MASTSRSLVLGFAAGLPADLFRPFADSLRATGFRGRLGIITAHCTDEQRRAFADLADLHWDVDREFQPAASPKLVQALKWARRTRVVRRAYPYFFQAAARFSRERNSQRRWEYLEYQLEGLQALRYGLYQQFIDQFNTDADMILISDLRDVIFQGDPFEPDVEGLEFFLEDSASKLGTEPFNRRWLEHLYGPEVVSSVAECTTSCSGTTVGDRPAIMGYLSAMRLEMQWRRRPLGSHDQGAHNHLIRHDRFSDARLIENGHGRVLTMGMMSTPSLDSAGRVLNADGTVPPILHQYDRHPELADRLTSAIADLSRASGTTTRGHST